MEAEREDVVGGGRELRCWWMRLKEGPAAGEGRTRRASPLRVGMGS